MTPRFATLLDWVEGRLPVEKTEEIAAVVATDDKALETIEWIREFQRAAELNVLHTPPEEVRAELRALFSRVHGGAGLDRQAAISFDTRTQRAAGVRSPSVDLADVDHVVVTDGPTRVVMTMLSTAEGLIDVQGRVERLDAASAPVAGEVVFALADGVLRVARLDPNGGFVIEGVDEVDTELWFLGQHARFRCRLRLEPR